MRILVTGNMGYVGPVVVEHLRARFPDADIHGFDCGWFGACLTGTEVLPEVRVDRQYFGDVRRFDPSILDSTDFIVHLAAVSNDPIGNLYEKATYEINHTATVNLAREAKQAGVRGFVFASSCSMYGFADSGPRTEESPLNPLTPYARSKVLAEDDLKKLADPGFRVTSLRFSTACGMSSRLRLDLVLNDFVACAVAGQPVTVLSDGTPWRPLIHVRDMARAVEWALLSDGKAAPSGYLAVNVGSNQWNYQVQALAHAVADRVEGVRVSINTEAPPDRRSYRVDFSLFRELAPDHQPSMDLSGSIVELREGLAKMRFGDADFRSSMLMRINHLTGLRERGALDDDLRWSSEHP